MHINKEIEEQFIERLENIGAIFHGHVCFTPGIHTDIFVRGGVVLKDEVTFFLLIDAVLRELILRRAKITPLAAKEYTVVSHKLNARVIRKLIPEFERYGLNIAQVREKEDKLYFNKRQTGLLQGKKIILLDDFVTFGGSFEKLYRSVLEAEGDPQFAVVFWNRNRFQHRKLPIYSLITKKLNHWRKADCPLCQAGEALVNMIGYGHKV